ncbi:MAG: hypothetical protein RIS60_1656 [Pseudomonadota bacterium]
MQSEVVMTMSMTMVTMAGPAAADPSKATKDPSKATNKGTPMKPVLGNAPTKAPKAPSFQPMRWFMVTANTKATMIRAQNQLRDGRTGTKAKQHAGQCEEQHKPIEPGNGLKRQHLPARGPIAAKDQCKEGKGDAQDI